jgi:hypothetical protein
MGWNADREPEMWPRMDRLSRVIIVFVAVWTIVATAPLTGPAFAACEGRACVFEREGWTTDFSNATVNLDEVLSGGPPRDGIPSIDDPSFVAAAEDSSLTARDPVIGLIIDGDARAYPLRILTWHEIVNDTVGGVPVAVTYCPLCNAAIVFDRRVGGRTLTFGTTGKLRRSDLIMYDRQTETWWQQFVGEGIAGDLAGRVLETIPARLESWADFKARAPGGRVLIPNDPALRDYGRNPYAGYDAVLGRPFLYRGPYDLPVPMMMRVVAVGDTAWTLPYLKKRGTVRENGLVLTWRSGQASALDSSVLADGRDVGTVVVRDGGGANANDVVYDVTFAFVFNAFRPQGRLIHDPADVR